VEGGNQLQSLAWHCVNRLTIFNSYEAGWVSASLFKWLIVETCVCFYGKLNVLLPGWCWLLYRAALLNDICTNTAPHGWRKAGFSHINSSLSYMKLHVDSDTMWPCITSTDKELPIFQRGLTLQSSVQECPKHSPPIYQSLICKFPDCCNCQHFAVLTYCRW
jgi:hypothetical protein